MSRKRTHDDDVAVAVATDGDDETEPPPAQLQLCFQTPRGGADGCCDFGSRHGLIFLEPLDVLACLCVPRQQESARRCCCRRQAQQLETAAVRENWHRNPPACCGPTRLSKKKIVILKYEIGSRTDGLKAISARTTTHCTSTTALTISFCRKRPQPFSCTLCHSIPPHDRRVRWRCGTPF